MKKLILILIMLPMAASANVVGSDIQNFNPTTSGIDFVTVQSSKTLDPGVFNFGAFYNYAVNVIPNYDDSSSIGNRTNFDDTLGGLDLNFGVGLTKNWDFGFSMPQILHQDSRNQNRAVQAEISQTGITEYRFNTKYRLKEHWALVATMNLNQAEDNPFTGSDPGPTWTLEGVYDFSHGKWNYGINAGYRMRDQGTQIPGVPIEPFGDSVIASVAASRYVEDWDMKFIGEIYSSFNVEDTQATTDRDLSSMELLGGLKKDLRHDLALHFGAATELYHGSSSPDWRVYAGLNYNLGPFWGQKDSDEGRVLSPDTTYAGSIPVTTDEKFLVGDVLFAFGSDQISPAFEEVLMDLAGYLKSTGFDKLEVEGHTDSVGREEFNQELSERRAKAVVDFLGTNGGISSAKLDFVGYGESRPVADNSNYQGRAKNRRVEFNVSR